MLIMLLCYYVDNVGGDEEKVRGESESIFKCAGEK